MSGEAESETAERSRRAILRHYDERLENALVDEYYDGSGFLNFGYWVRSQQDARLASEALVDQLLALVGACGNRILDVACGAGATTRYLERRLPGARLVGINLSSVQLVQARARASGAVLCQQDAARLAFRDASFDSVLCVEAAFHFDSREDFLRETLRVLRPGGALALSDVLLVPGGKRQHWNPRNHVGSLQDYCELWESIGFDGVQVLDRTEECWRRAFRQVVRFAHRKLWEGAIGPEAKEAFLERIYRLAEDLAHYVLAVGRRPTIGSRPRRRLAAPSFPPSQLRATPASSNLFAERTGRGLFSEEASERSGDAGYDSLMYWPALEEYFGHSDFVNYGYWEAGTKNAREASERLLDRLLGMLPDKHGRILDVACGKGATTRHLLGHYDPGSVYAIDVSRKQLQRSNDNAPGCHFGLMDAARLGFGASSFDTVICVEAAFHFNTREDFLREVHRALTPGGWLVLSDLLLTSVGEAGRRVGTEANFVAGPEEYAALCRRVGFREVQVVDATRRTLEASFWNLVDFSHERLLDGRMSAAELRAFTRRFFSWVRDFRYYLLASMMK